MKKKIVNAIALGLATCTLMSGLAGCGQAENMESSTNAANASVSTQASSESQGEDAATTVKKEGYPIVDETMSLSVVNAWVQVATDPEECDIYNEIAELTNVDIEWEMIQSTAWEDKKGLLLARKELPDVLLSCFMTDAEYLNMVDAGQVIAIDEYLDYAPNFQKVLENSPGLKEAITASDGHIYAFPYVIGAGAETYNCMTNNVTYINQKWLDAVDKEIPTTTEELKEVLVAFKEQDPNGNELADEIPLTAKGGVFDDWFGAFGIVPSANELGVKNLTIVDGEVTYAPIRDEYRAALDYFHELWELGVLDPETFTQDSSMFNAKLKAETRVAGMFECWRGTSWRLNNEDDEYAILPAMTGPDGDCMYPQNYTGLYTRSGAMISSDCENIELAVRWIDTLIDPKYSYQFWTDTREGYHYADNGGATYEQLVANDSNDPVQNAMVDMRFICVDQTTIDKSPVVDDPFNVNNEKAVSDAIYKPFYPEEHYPNIFLTVEESNNVAEIYTDLDLYMNQFYANWIINGGDDAAWESHLKQLESLRVNEWIKVYADAYDRYNSFK